MLYNEVMRNKLYRFLYDVRTGLYKGLTYEFPWPDNSTIIQPHFETGFKPLWDFEFGVWKLMPQEIFFKQMSSIDEVSNAVEFKNNVIVNEIANLYSHNQHYFQDINIRFNEIDSRASWHSKKFKECCDEIKTDNFNLQKSVGENQDMLIELKDSVFVLSVLVERIALEQEKHYLYSRKFYWTSRFIDFATQFCVRSRNIFFKFFNS